MTGYVIITRVKTRSDEGLDEYRALAPLAPSGKAEIVVPRGSQFEVVEGDNVEGVVILKFPTHADAVAWYKSPEYQAAVPHRQKGADFFSVIVEGVA